MRKRSGRGATRGAHVRVCCIWEASRLLGLFSCFWLKVCAYGAAEQQRTLLRPKNKSARLDPPLHGSLLRLLRLLQVLRPQSRRIGRLPLRLRTCRVPGLGCLRLEPREDHVQLFVALDAAGNGGLCGRKKCDMLGTESGRVSRSCWVPSAGGDLDAMRGCVQGGTFKAGDDVALRCLSTVPISGRTGRRHA